MLDLLAATGVQILEVAPRSSADQAGLQAGDVIVSLADRVVETMDDLHRLLSIVSPDQPIPLQVLRQDELVQLTVESSN